MVFRGKPSKACKRCRERRLKCDFGVPCCGPCIRAGTPCTGYRDTHQLRIANETQAVREKALSRHGYSIKSHSLVPSLELRARDAFFEFHVTKVSKSWDFLQPFSDPTRSPEHLALSIDAVSLAYLSYMVSSDVALLEAREKYVLALRLTNKALSSPELALKDTTLLAALLLDLFEKLTNISRKSNSWMGHVNGALTLVKMRGINNFRDTAALRVLARVSNNLIISKIIPPKFREDEYLLYNGSDHAIHSLTKVLGYCATATPVPPELVELREHITKFSDHDSLKERLSNLMITYANLWSEMKSGKFSNNYYLERCSQIDAQYKSLCDSAHEAWSYTTRFLDEKTERCYTGYLDIYPRRQVTQAWNVLRLVRILVNNVILERGHDPPEGLPTACSPRVARDKIAALALDMCASVPQYVDCQQLARDKWPVKHESGDSPTHDKALAQGVHGHSPEQILACYNLIFPLAIAAQSEGCPKELRSWIIDELHYIAVHFSLRNAEVVAQILERGVPVYPWDIYSMLGSYAFMG